MFKPIRGIQVTTLLLLSVILSFKLFMTGKSAVAKLPKWNWIIKIKVIKNKLDKNQKAHLGYLGRDWFNLLCLGGCSASSSALQTTCSILIVRLAIIIRYSCCSIMPFFRCVLFIMEIQLRPIESFSRLKNALRQFQVSQANALYVWAIYCGE